jgi:hypothetical protein
MPDKTTMSEEHRKRHEQLHKALQEIWDDFVTQTNPTFNMIDGNISFLDIYMWSAKQTRGEME